MRFRHVALFVGDDLRGAESYYCRLFDMEVVLREGPLKGDGPDAPVWGQLPLTADWDDADAAGVTIGMVALQRGDLILPLFAAPPSGERFYAIGVVADREEIAAIEGRLEEEWIEAKAEGWLSFVDRLGVRWQLSEAAPFRGAGTTRGLWLEV